ncbi:MAG: MoxR family ATPase [Oscillospiraceae bacterium]|nr:MoxR family ATPase [Oscillospiraceae bacterium]
MNAFEMINAVKENIRKVIIGKDKVTDFIITALLCNGHVLIEDVPGSGKTMLAKSFAVSLDCDFKRIQFTPDLLPSDITGIKYFNMKKSEFEFIPGSVFSNIILADEINRATPKTQSGLLECMEEQQVTIEGETHKLPAPFMVIATQNPIENMGVFPLPEAQLDRFLIKVDMGYPSYEESVDILDRFDKNNPIKNLKSVISREDIIKAQEEINNIYVHKDLYGYITSIAEATRRNSGVILGVSPRGCIALLKVSKGMAAVNNRAYVTPDDIKAAAVPVMAHRLILKTSVSLKKGADSELINEITDSITVPTEDFDKYRL